jgi:acyl-CoA synthetase
MILASAQQIEEYTSLGAWSDVTLDAMFRANVTAYPDRVAAVDPPNRASFTFGMPLRLTYRELNQAVDRISGAFLTAGLRKDDIVVVQMPNIVELVCIYLACARIGVIISPVPAQYREHELRHIFELTRPAAYVATTNVKGFNHAAMIAGWPGGFSGKILAFGDAPPDGVLAIEDLASSAQADAVTTYVQENPIDANDIYSICWTSGTEGVPKGVPRSHNNWRVSAWSVADGSGLMDGDHSLNPFPMTNMASIGSLFCTWLLTGGRFVLHQPFDLKIFLDQLRDEKITFTIAAPAVLNMMLKEGALMEGSDISALRSVGSGSAPLDPWMMREFQDRFGIAIVNFFGSNEGINLNGGAREIKDPERRARFFPRFGAGGYTWHNRVSRWIKTKLVDPVTGEEITEPGRQGEMAVRGPSIFPGYFRAHDINQRAFDGDGYFLTGDLFEIACEDGDPRHYHFVGRCKEIIIRGGMNISPAELDALLNEHPKLREAAAVGYPDPIFGERVCAVVVLNPGETISLEDIVAFLREKRIAAFKLPERMFVVDALPRSPMNKLLRRELTKLFDTQPSEGLTV